MGDEDIDIVFANSLQIHDRNKLLSCPRASSIFSSMIHDQEGTL